jgi:hypothetical protein
MIEENQGVEVPLQIAREAIEMRQLYATLPISGRASVDSTKTAW